MGLHDPKLVAEDMSRKWAGELFAALFFLVSAIGTALAPNVWLVVAFRVVGGIGVGVPHLSSPLPTLPRHRRRASAAPSGHFNSWPSFPASSSSFAINWVLQHIAGGPNEPLALGLDAWRWMFMVMAIPALLYGGLAFTIPEVTSGISLPVTRFRKRVAC